MSEEKIAASVVSWLKEQHWKVYQEVVTYRGSSRADIVATMGPVVWVIEVKCGITLAILDQAMYWLGHAHYVSVAAPPSHSGWNILNKLCGSTGLGIISVSGDNCEVRYAAKLCRKIHPGLKKSLREEQVDFAPAGNASCKYWSPYKETCRAVLTYVQGHPGCSMKECIEGIKAHHYASDKTALSALTHWIKALKVDGVEARREGRRLALYERAS